MEHRNNCKEVRIEVFNNLRAYAYEDTVTYQESFKIRNATPVSYTGKSYVTCDYNGEEGMFLLGWAGVESKIEFDLDSFKMFKRYKHTEHSPSVKFFPFIMDSEGTKVVELFIY